MTDRLDDTTTPDHSDPLAGGMTKGYPPPEQWYLMGENYSAARRALYTARAQLR
jgi:hypothetical protein